MIRLSSFSTLLKKSSFLISGTEQFAAQCLSYCTEISTVQSLVPFAFVNEVG